MAPHKSKQHIIITSMIDNFDEKCCDICEGCTMIEPHPWEEPTSEGCQIHNIRAYLQYLQQQLESDGNIVKIRDAAPKFCKIPTNDCNNCRFSVEDCMNDYQKRKKEMIDEKN